LRQRAPLPRCFSIAIVAVHALPSANTRAAKVESSLSYTDNASVFQYALMLRYPNGRTFNYRQESERRLDVGDEFDAFGRTWRIECELPPTRLNPASLSSPKAFACDPLSESSLRKGEADIRGRV
jgi:hypothetical protein